MMEEYQASLALYQSQVHEWRMKCCALLIENLIKVKKRKIAAVYAFCLEEIDQKKRKYWVSPLCDLRPLHGFFAAIFPTLCNMDREFLNYFRMSVLRFESLLALVGPTITKKRSVREPISAGERLCLTLRYLATGDLMISFHYSYLLGLSTVHNIIKETCSVIWNELSSLVLPSEISEERWIRVSKEFQDIWNFPNAIAAVDGKHIRVQKPINAGSEFFNYKRYHSIVLLAACDAKYKFLAVDIGGVGRRSDGGVFASSNIGQKFRNGDMNVPPPRTISAYNSFRFPFVIVGDEAFPLEEWLMRPFPKACLGPYERTYNYRLSRARRTIENAFGILVNRWRIFFSPICTYVQTAEEIVKACTCLHNWLIENDDIADENNEYVDVADHYQDDGTLVEGRWRADGFGALTDISHQGRNNYTRDASKIREKFRDYFNEEGRLWWQQLHIQNDQ